MSLYRRIRSEGVSLGKAYLLLMVLVMLASGLLIYLTHSLSDTFQRLSAAADQYIEMQKASAELLDAQDYLTEMVQRYTIDGNSAYLRNYFEEALENRRREDAIARMSDYPELQDDIAQLRSAMDESSKLTERDYYAMRLVVEAVGVYPVPEALRDIVLLPEHALLPSFEKKTAAQHMVSDEEYYRQKDSIRENMRDAVQKLEEKTKNVQLDSEMSVKAGMRTVRVFSIIQAVAAVVMFLLARRLSIMPILKAADKLREDSPIPVVGAKEFRYLASTYNRMFEVYKSSVANLSFKASHDELTQVYNRAGYDLLLSRMELRDVGFLIMDVDCFKHVNDTYGHDIGDKVLQKVAAALKRNFRGEDFICRIGGDEFVVLIQHTDRLCSEMLRKKFERISAELADTTDGLPAVSLSVGGAFGNEVNGDAALLFERADQALYESKRNGRARISFAAEQTV